MMSKFDSRFSQLAKEDAQSSLEMKKGSSSKKRKLSEKEAESPIAKRKRVSFGPKLSPELFVKKLPPSTPVRRGALPPRLPETKDCMSTPQSLLKRKSAAATTQGSIKEESPVKSSPVKLAKGTLNEKQKSPTKSISPNARKSPKRGTPGHQTSGKPVSLIDRKSRSPKPETPAKQGARSVTPKGRKSQSPKPETPAKQGARSVSPKGRKSQSPKPETPAKQGARSVSPKGRKSQSPKPETPAKQGARSCPLRAGNLGHLNQKHLQNKEQGLCPLRAGNLSHLN